MKVHFTREYIDELLSNIDITEVMKDNGVQVMEGSKHNYFIADFCCGKKDFDNGRIRKNTGFYKCLSCGKGGHAIHFLENVRGLKFPEAVKELAKKAGMPLPQTDIKQQIIDERKRLALSLAVSFYQRQSNDYLQSRGISAEVLKKYRAGYAPGGRNLRNYLEGKGFSKDELLEFKLINKNGLDYLFNRAIIPIYMNGKVIDLYARSVKDNDSVKHLYLYGNTPFLGGYDFLKCDQMAIIYESFIDQLVAESYGIFNGVNSGGAHKFTINHARFLKKKRVCKALIIFDGDKAGREGALVAGALIEKMNINTWVGELPEGTDPADLITKLGAKEFRNQVSGRTFKQFELFCMLNKYDLADIKQYLNEKENRHIQGRIEEKCWS